MRAKSNKVQYYDPRCSTAKHKRVLHVSEIAQGRNESEILKNR